MMTKNQMNLMKQKKCLAFETPYTTQDRSEINDLNRSLNCGSGSSLDISQIKGYLADLLKPEHLETLVQKVKDTFVNSTIVNGDKNRHHAHICVVCDCLLIGMEDVKFIEKDQLLINSSKLCVSAFEQYYDGDGVSLHED
jgi:hypothetical protein